MPREERRLQRQNIYMFLILELKMIAVVMIIAVLMSVICRAYDFLNLK
jgi:predicted nucleic acid-binding Zn ribbon protein